MKSTGAGRCVLIAGGLVLGMTGCLGSREGILPTADAAGSTAVTTTFVLIRHAERGPGADPPLNAEGQRRAQALRDALGDSGVTAIYCTDLRRNRETVQPLADALGIPLHLVNPVRYANTTLAAEQLVAEILAAERGGIILFCGNIGSVLGTPGITEEIFHRIGGTAGGPIRYQDMFIVVAPDNAPATFIRAEYGEASSLD